MNKLPIFLSIPHGGTKKPPELSKHLCISDEDLFYDTDPFVSEIYDLTNKVQYVLKTDIARTFVDLNRSLQDMPPNNPDGLIKSMTCYEKTIYIQGHEPDEQLRNLLIKNYYLPYHRQIQKIISDSNLQVCLDCHSMASTAPQIAPDKQNKKRPTFCISNQNGKTCSEEMISILANCISESFHVDSSDVYLNDPFKGGYITKTYGNNPIPWIQIEMNRDMYLSEEWFDKNSLTITPKRLEELNHMFENTLNLFSKIWI